MLSPAPWWGCVCFLYHSSYTWDPVEFTTLLLSVWEYPLIQAISVQGSRHKVNFVVYRMQCSFSTAEPRIVKGHLPLGYPQVTPPMSLPPAWEGPGLEATLPAALPKPMAIKGPEMEEPDKGARLLLEPKRDHPVCPRRLGLPGCGSGSLDGGKQPSSLEQGQESGARCAPSISLYFPGDTFGLCLKVLGTYIMSREGLGVGVELPFHWAPEPWGCVGQGACRGLSRWPPTSSPQTMAALCRGFTHPAPFPVAQLVTFYHLHIHMGIQRAQMQCETTKCCLPPLLFSLYSIPREAGLGCMDGMHTAGTSLRGYLRGSP